MLLLVPWGAVFEWTMRLGGLAVLGPHMYWIGKHIKVTAGRLVLVDASDVKDSGISEQPQVPRYLQRCSCPEHGAKSMFPHGADCNNSSVKIE